MPVLQIVKRDFQLLENRAHERLHRAAWINERVVENLVHHLVLQPETHFEPLAQHLPARHAGAGPEQKQPPVLVPREIDGRAHDINRERRAARRVERGLFAQRRQQRRRQRLDRPRRWTPPFGQQMGKPQNLKLRQTRLDHERVFRQRLHHKAHAVRLRRDTRHHVQHLVFPRRVGRFRRRRRRLLLQTPHAELARRRGHGHFRRRLDEIHRQSIGRRLARKHVRRLNGQRRMRRLKRHRQRPRNLSLVGFIPRFRQRIHRRRHKTRRRDTPRILLVDETHGRTSPRIARIQDNARDVRRGPPAATKTREVNLNRLRSCQLQFHPQQSVAKIVPCVNAPLVRIVLVFYLWQKSQQKRWRVASPWPRCRLSDRRS